MIPFNKPSQALKTLYGIICSEKCWQAVFNENNIHKKDEFVRQFNAGLYGYAQSINQTAFTLEMAYEFVLSQIAEKSDRVMTPSLEGLKTLCSCPSLYMQVCNEFYNNPLEEPVLALLRYRNGILSLQSFACKYIPEMYKVLDPRTTRYIHPFYLSRVILDDIIFDDYQHDRTGAKLQLKALTLLFRESLGTQHAHNLTEGYTEYINQMYKQKPIRKHVDELARNIYLQAELSEVDKNALLRKIDKLDEMRYKRYQENMPSETYKDKYFTKKRIPYINFISTPMGGQNKRY